MNAASVLKRIFPLLFALVILTVIELGLRAVVHLLDLELDIVVVHPHLGQAELKKQIYENDRYLLWRMKPGLDGRFVSPALKPEGRERPRFTVVTNSHGYNDSEFTVEKSPGVFRIVCMGNSSTFGWGVPPDSCYASLLEDMLHERSGRDIEVINAAVPGYSSAQGLVMLQREVLPLSPDVVTLSFGANDSHTAGHPDRELIAKRIGIVGALQEALSRFTLYRGLRYLVVSRKVKSEFGQVGQKGVRRVKPREFRENMSGAIQLAEDSGAEVVLIAVLPGSPGLEPYRRVLADTGREYGLPVIDTGKIFSSFLADPKGEGGIEDAYLRETEERYGERTLENHPDLPLRLDRVHPTVLGHLLIARALADTVLHLSSGEPR